MYAVGLMELSSLLCCQARCPVQTAAVQRLLLPLQCNVMHIAYRQGFCSNMTGCSIAHLSGTRFQYPLTASAAQQLLCHGDRAYHQALQREDVQ